MAHKKKNRCASCKGPKRGRKKYCSKCNARRCRVKCTPRRKKRRRMHRNPQLQIFENPGCGYPCDCCGVGLKANPGDACCMGCAVNPMVCNPCGNPPPPRRRRKKRNP